MRIRLAEGQDGANGKLIPWRRSRIEARSKKSKGLRAPSETPPRAACRRQAFGLPAGWWFESQGTAGSSLRDANHVLPEQIERDGEQHDILHQKRDVAGHRRKAGRRIPTLRHEGNDRGGCD